MEALGNAQKRCFSSGWDFWEAQILIRQFQRKLRTEGIAIQCDAFKEPLRLRGRVTKITEDEIRVRLHTPCYWRIKSCTWVEGRYLGYKPLEVDLVEQTVQISRRARAKAEFLLKLAWIRAKDFSGRNAKSGGQLLV